MDFTKISFGFTPADMKLLRKIKAWMALTQGPVSNIAAIRAALREMAAKLERYGRDRLE